jgi:hypothetical protein
MKAFKQYQECNPLFPKKLILMNFQQQKCSICNNSYVVGLNITKPTKSIPTHQGLSMVLGVQQKALKFEKS